MEMPSSSWSHELGCPLALQLRHVCIKTDVFARALDMISAAFGGRLQAAEVATYISADSEINWGAVGVFSSSNQDDKVERVLHHFLFLDVEHRWMKHMASMLELIGN